MKLKLYFLSAILLSLFSQSTIAQQRQRLVFHSNGLVSFASFDNRYNPHGYNILQVSFYYDERLNIDSWWRSQKVTCGCVIRLRLSIGLDEGSNTGWISH